MEHKTLDCFITEPGNWPGEFVNKINNGDLGEKGSGESTRVATWTPQIAIKQRMTNVM